jgi:hypothetical protein
LGIGHEFDQGTLEVLEHVMDDGVLFGEPIDHRLEICFAGAQMREDVGVLKTVMQSDHAAVRSTVGTYGPIVLSDRELVEQGHRFTR